ncbi:sulfate reduction electron transfer complex DsrMKJOP subunit DsrO [Varunaivibrio sulfuroxidans]|uniref:Tetrathionate reductase subunit B n=1 Tax=Varunaivibrio sulfuroxidans TaxID=1773489 RepID=A0A4R3J5G4_9PROT|nr:4Fe-4S dicluster domain-containing protein [Varunaivibrio sulfuroxidans]TCS60557.1 tetrathionate reductase subunit B [Varunaivibrio sulfuroxidans]WES30047.1 4Fe-4S dicluster domain-containing protein [Varunaivibrio sulfuroxidans]
MNQDKGVSRRSALKQLGTGAAAAAAVAASPAAALGATPAKRYAMVIDTRKCVGCHACSVSCKTENDVPLGETRSWVEYIEKGDFPEVRRSFLPRLCNQCEKPQCVSVCPTGATYKRKEDGIVVIDSNVCIGCKYCVQACPYGMRFINPTTGAADKCDFCLHRVENGLVPACVNTCQGKARIFGDLNDPDSVVSKAVRANALTVLRPEMGTGPMVFYIDADHTDARDAARLGTYVRIETNRRQQERV